jgi:hypothetical protein
VSGEEENWGSTFRAKFYEEQFSLLEKNKTDELIDGHYHEDAALIWFQKIVPRRPGMEGVFSRISGAARKPSGVVAGSVR